MRIWFIAALTGLLAYAGVTMFKPQGDTDREKLIMQAIVQLLNKQHFKEVQLNDEFSHRVFDIYIDRLDGMKRFLTIGELDLLDDYRDSLDDHIIRSDLRFFELSYRLIDDAIGKTRKWYPEILGQPFDFTRPDSIETDGEKRSWARDDAELKSFWQDYLKYETLVRLADKLAEQEDAAEEPEGGKKSVAELEAEARKDVQEVFDDWYERMDKVRRSDRYEMYLNSITNVYDPHSDYFNPKEKEDFDISMSGRLEGIGARLQMDGDFTKVISIVPGGPAWKQKDLEVDDKIFKVRQETEAEPVDVTGWLVDEVVTLIRGPKGTKVSLTVRKKDGSVREITIERDEVILDEGFAKSAILELDGEIGNVGYISLPKFYADFENPNGRSCAEDVETEVRKLMSAEVKGIILDLRNNSGGSLNDVVKMSGLFIEEGPIVQVKSRQGEPYALRDRDKSVVYAGPLIVMVNEQSASASEILAAAMQDYGRAIIVGSSSTFGKGTVQRFLELDKAVTGYDQFKPLGDLKLTMQKFYRVDGGSTQLRGVTSDIILPDSYQFIPTGEREMEYPMEWTEVAPIEHRQDIVDLSNIDKIRERSEERVKASAQFAKVNEYALQIKENQEETVVPLQLDQYRALDKTRAAESEAFRKAFGQIDRLKMNNLAIDLPAIQADSSRLGRNEAWFETLKKDIYIEETLQIMKDLAAVHHKS
jgi:carboxyl-terminal processing protease